MQASSRKKMNKISKLERKEVCQDEIMPEVECDFDNSLLEVTNQ